MNFLFISIWPLLFGTVLNVKIEQVVSPRSLCGEGPHWDESTQSLYYIDIDGPNETLLRYDFNENKTYSANVDGVPLMTFILPVEGTTDEFLVGTKHSGTIVPLYSYEKGLSVKILMKNVAISNGLTWVQKQDNSGYLFYYVDSCTHDLLAFDYDINTGELSNEQIVFSVNENGQAPDFIFDGMTNDVEGNLYIATYNGGKVMKVDPLSGQLLAEYKIPSVDQITSVAFGGPNLDILFVTTASRGNQPTEAGHLYKITELDAIGTAGVKVNV